MWRRKRANAVPNPLSVTILRVRLGGKRESTGPNQSGKVVLSTGYSRNRSHQLMFQQVSIK
jgi:hypothetical protein